jgi:hypothetical protein
MATHNQIEIPVQPFALFIEAATKWLAKTSEIKKGLEIRLFKEGSDLHVSVGADSAFLEAVLDADVSILDQPVYLDMSYLSDYPFDVDTLAMVKPGTGSTAVDRRAQFKAPGQNFRIPVRSGDNWKRNEQNMAQFDTVPGIKMTHKFMKEIYPNLDLPDSFGMKKKVPQRIVFKKIQDKQIEVYSEDEFGAFSHSFTSDDFSFLESFTQITLLHDFFIPQTKVESFSHITLKQSSRLSFGEIHMTGGGFKRLRWLQPNHTKPLGEISESVKAVRQGIDWSLQFDLQDLVRNVDKATIFYRAEKEFQASPLEFSIIKDSYLLSAKLTHSEMNMEGKTKNEAPAPTRIKFQAACLRDYLKVLDKTQPMNMEIFPQTVIVYQQYPNKNILYWMPILAR